MGVLDEFNALEDEYNRERANVICIIEKVVRGIKQNPAINPINVNCYTICYSELLNSPWSPEFHNWEKQADLLLSILIKKPVKLWLEYITVLIETKCKNTPRWNAVTVDKIQLNKIFLQEVQKQLQSAVL